MSAVYEPVLQRIRHALRSNRLAHAYILQGDAGPTLEAAYAISAVVLCEKEEGCGVCSACRLCTRRSHPDVLLLRPGGRAGVISIDEIRQVIRFTMCRPYIGRRKVVILAEAERLTVEAANAFLKTLEEPLGNTLLLLLSERPAVLPETVQSRCQVIRLSGHGEDTGELLERALARELRAELSRAARCHDPLEAAAQAQKILEIADRLAEKREAQGEESEETQADRRKALISLMAALFRDPQTSGAAESPEIHDENEWLRWIARLERLESLLNRYVDVRLALEDILLRD